MPLCVVRMRWGFVYFLTLQGKLFLQELPSSEVPCHLSFPISAIMTGLLQPWSLGGSQKIQFSLSPATHCAGLGPIHSPLAPHSNLELSDCLLCYQSLLKIILPKSEPFSNFSFPEIKGTPQDTGLPLPCTSLSKYPLAPC